MELSNYEAMRDFSRFTAQQNSPNVNNAVFMRGTLNTYMLTCYICPCRTIDESYFFFVAESSVKSKYINTYLAKKQQKTKAPTVHGSVGVHML